MVKVSLDHGADQDLRNSATEFIAEAKLDSGEYAGMIRYFERVRNGN